jgi:hypothetical protein
MSPAVRSEMTDTAPVADGAKSRLAIYAAGFLGVLLALTIGLWAHYGSAVFYEMILAGLAACF